MTNVTLRLHRQHDMDLIALFRANDYKFAREMKQVLVAFANGEVYEPKVLEVEDFDPGYIPTSVTFHIALNPNKERESAAIRLLRGVKMGYRNSFLKALFRTSITVLPLMAFAIDNGLVTKKDTFESFHRSRMDAAKHLVAKEPVTKAVESETIVAKESVTEMIESEIIVTKEVTTEKVVTKDETTEDIAVTVLKDEVVETETNDTDDLTALFGQMSNMAHM